MKKKALKITLLICGILLVGLLAWSLTDRAVISVAGQTAEASFSDSWALRALLQMQKTDFTKYGCGFSPDYSVRIGVLTYCVAKDDCNSIWIKELNLYYTVQREKHANLKEKLVAYWASSIRTTVSESTFAAFEKRGENGYKIISSEISTLYTFDSLRIRPAIEQGSIGDWLYRIVFNPNVCTGQENELVILFGASNLSVNGQICTAAEGVSYSDVLKWAAAKYDHFDYALQVEPEIKAN